MDGPLVPFPTRDKGPCNQREIQGVVVGVNEYMYEIIISDSRHKYANYWFFTHKKQGIILLS